MDRPAEHHSADRPEEIGVERGMDWDPRLSPLTPSLRLSGSVLNTTPTMKLFRGHYERERERGGGREREREREGGGREREREGGRGREERERERERDRQRQRG